MLTTKSVITRASILAMSAIFVLVTLDTADAASRAKKRWRTVRLAQMNIVNNGDSANVSLQGNQIHMEILSNANTTLLDLKRFLVANASRVNVKFKQIGCSTTPVAMSISFGLGTQARGANWIVGSHTVDFQARQLSSMITSQPTSGGSGTVMAESYWNMRFLLAESTADVTASFGRTGFSGSAVVSARATGKRKEGKTALTTPGRLGKLPRPFIFIAPVLEQGLNDACKIVITKVRVFY